MTLTIERPIRRLLAVIGDKPLSEYTREDANQFRGWLYDDEDKVLKKSPLSTSSVKRSMDSVNSVFNLANQKKCLVFLILFLILDISRNHINSSFHSTWYIKQFRSYVFNMMMISNWLIALISDTGLRLGEAAGSERKHVELYAYIPH